MHRPSPGPRVLYTAALALTALPLWAAVPAIASAAVNPAGLLPSPVASVLASAVPGATPTPTQSPSVGASGGVPQPVNQLLNTVTNLLSPTATPGPGGASPTAAPITPSGTPSANLGLPVPRRSPAVDALTGTSRTRAGHRAKLAPGKVGASDPATVVTTAQDPAQALTPSLSATAVALPQLAAPQTQAIPLGAAAPSVTAHNAQIAEAQRRSTNRVSNALAAVALGCVVIAAAGQVAARRRTRP